MDERKKLVETMYGEPELLKRAAPQAKLTEREAFVRAMYGGDGPSGFRAEPRLSDGIAQHDKLSRIKVGDSEVEVPSVRYVRALEATVDELRRQVKRHEVQLRQMRKQLSGHGGDFREVWSELDRKLDGR